MLKPYNIDPTVPDKQRVIAFLKEGKPPKEIIQILGKKPNYKTTISKYKKQATENAELRRVTHK